MRVVSVTVTRNDADLIEAFVRHHLGIVDRMLIFSTRCSDNTREIVDALRAEGIPIEHHSYDASDGETRDCRLTDHPGSSIHRLAGFLTGVLHDVTDRHRPDWVLPIDVDEFLGADTGTVRELIEKCPGDAVTLLNWSTYVPTPEDDPAQPNLVRRILHRRRRDDPRFTKALIPGRLARRPDVRLSNGNHRLLDGSSSELPCAPAEGIFLAHFPVRSERQLRSKIISGFLSLIASPVRSELDAYQWRRLFPRCVDPREISPAELSEIAKMYGWLDDAAPDLVRAPLATASESIRYPIRPQEPWDVLVESGLHLANEVHRLALDRLKLEESRRAEGG